MPTFRYVVADVFTDRPLTGNQLAVFTDAREIPDEQLQPLAKEMNFSETVFVYPPEQGGHVKIRIFTPAAEMPFAGHPVLGSAFVLAGPLQLITINLETLKGIVPVELEREGARIVFGRMSQPIPEVSPFDQETDLLTALRIERSELPDRALRPGDQARVRRPSLGGSGRGARARLCGACSDPGLCGDELLRRLWHALEDAHVRSCRRRPRGSGHRLGGGPPRLSSRPARSDRLGEEIEISQGEEIGRPSTLYARAHGSTEAIERVEVGGSAVVVARGEFRL